MKLPNGMDVYYTWEIYRVKDFINLISFNVNYFCGTGVVLWWDDLLSTE